MKIFIALLSIFILVSIEVDLLAPSLPQLKEAYHLSAFTTQLILSINFGAFCLGALLFGSIGDKFGYRLIILLGLTTFTGGAMLCFVTDQYIFILCGRLLQGIGISGPSVLVYNVLAEEYTIKDQQKKLAIINGISSFALALAPVIGSYINLQFTWRGNFLLLFALGIIVVSSSYFYIPYNKTITSKQHNPTQSYLTLIKSPRLLCYVTAISFMILPYWIFLGMSSILYVQDFGMPLKNFGFYQGALAFTFCIISIVSVKLLGKFSNRQCFYLAIAIMFLSSLMIICVSSTKNPLLISGSLLLYIGCLYLPLNMLYPLALESFPESKGKVSALIQSLILIFSALFLELVSYYYQSRFFEIAFTIITCLFIASIALGIMVKQGWIILKDNSQPQPNESNS